MADGELKPNQRIILTKGGRPLATPESASQSERPFLPLERFTSNMERLGPRQRMTTHQLAVQQNRKERVEHAIAHKLRRIDRKKRKVRMKEGAILRTWNRIKDLEDPLLASDDENKPLRYYDFGDDVKREEDDHPAKRLKTEKGRVLGEITRAPAGLLPRREEETGDEDDYGEEALSLASAIRRSTRRLDRWEKVDKGVLEVRGGFQVRREQLEELGDEEAEGETDDDGDGDVDME